MVDTWEGKVVQGCHRHVSHPAHSWISARQILHCPGFEVYNERDMYYNPETGYIQTYNTDGCITLPGGRIDKDLFPKLFEAIERTHNE